MGRYFNDKAVKEAQARMESARMGFDSLRADIAAMVLPNHAHFQGRYQTATGGMGQGQSRVENLYDEYGAIAAEDGVALFEGFLMPRGQKWQKIGIFDETLMKPLEHQRFFERVEKRIYGMRNDPRSGFVTNMHDSSAMVLCLGMQTMWIDKRFDRAGRFAGLSYQSEHIDGIWVERDAEGNVLRVHRKIVLTAEQAKHKWRERIPPKVQQALTGTRPNPSEEFEFLHVIEANPSMLDGRLDAAGMPWIAGYYSCKDDMMFIEGGYRTLRRITSCFDRAANESYGRGRANLVLGALRACQVMMQDRVLGTEMLTKPPLLAQDDDLDEGVVDLGPWGITYGGLDEQGNARLATFLDSIDLTGAKDLHGELRTLIDKVFYRDLLQINREMKTHITALRTSEEIGEKGILLAPLARQEQDWFSPMLDCELDLSWEEGLLDDMPPRLAAYFEAGHGITAIYDNELSRWQEMSGVSGYLRTAEQVAVTAQFDDGEGVRAFTRAYPPSKVVPEIARINGVPASWAATEAERKARDEAEAQAAQAQQLLEAAPVISQSVKNIAQAGAAGGA